MTQITIGFVLFAAGLGAIVLCARRAERRINGWASEHTNIKPLAWDETELLFAPDAKDWAEFERSIHAESAYR